MQQFISIQMHGFLDYLLGIAFIAVPWIFFQWDDPAANYTLLGTGIFILVYSEFTRYSYGLLKWIAFRYHMFLDYAAGVFLGTSPWIFGFFPETYLLHLCSGYLLISVAFFTRLEPGIAKKGHSASLQEPTES